MCHLGARGHRRRGGAVGRVHLRRPPCPALPLCCAILPLPADRGAVPRCGLLSGGGAEEGGGRGPCRGVVRLYSSHSGDPKGQGKEGATPRSARRRRAVGPPGGGSIFKPREGGKLGGAFPILSPSFSASSPLYFLHLFICSSSSALEKS